MSVKRLLGSIDTVVHPRWVLVNSGRTGVPTLAGRLVIAGGTLEVFRSGHVEFVMHNCEGSCFREGGSLDSRWLR